MEVCSEELNSNRVKSSVRSCGAGMVRLYKKARPYLIELGFPSDRTQSWVK